MDPLTQGLLGAATAQLGFRQKLGGATTWIAAITAMLADLDVFAGPILRLVGTDVDEFTLIRTHRALSHSLFAVPIIALLTAIPWWLCRRRKAKTAKTDYLAQTTPVVDRATHPEVAANINAELDRTQRMRPPTFLPFYACTLVAAATHGLLDYCTTYGTQLLSPLSNTRFALDAIPVIDFIYTPILTVTLITCWMVRKITPARAASVTLAIGTLGMILSTGYIAAGYALGKLATDRAVELAIDAGARRGDIREANAYPYLGTIFLWRTTVRTDDQWFVARIRPLNSEPVGQDDRQSAQIIEHPLIAKAEQLPQIETFTWFANRQIRAVYSLDSIGHVVTFHDMRYGDSVSSPTSMWPTEVRFDLKGNVTGVRRIAHYRGRGRLETLRRIWREIHR